MARTLDELRGIAVTLRQASMSKEVQVWLKELKQIAEERLAQDYVAKGEEAVRGLGFQQGVGVCMALADIFDHTLIQAEKANQQELKNKLKM